MARVLLIDDDHEFATRLQGLLAERGHAVRWLDLAEDGLQALASGEAVDLVLLDNKMPRMSGLELLAELKATDNATPVVLMTSVHNDRTVIQAMHLGAHDYVIKPLAEEEMVGELEQVIAKAVEITRRPPPVPLPLPADADADADDSVIVGRSRPLVDVLKQTARLAEMDDTVLILGETGTGKDLIARAIHTNSRRKARRLVVLNCTALNEGLLDDELFGHEAGSFTGAEKLRKGRFEHAEGGTLFLDEVGDMPLTLQAKLLRALENREVVRIGSNDPIKVDVRVLAATHRDLPAMVRQGQFRQDLFYRLEGMTIHLPPLRERTADIEPLAWHFLGRLFVRRGAAPGLHPAALERLRGYAWPGNIRQLKQVLSRAAKACRGAVIMPEDLDFGELGGCGAHCGPNGGGAPVGDDEAARAAVRLVVEWAWQSNELNLWPLLQQRLECALLRHALAQPGVSQVQLARRLGVARNTLRSRIEQYGLQPPAEG